MCYHTEAISDNLDLSQNANLQDVSLSDYLPLRRSFDWRNIVLERAASPTPHTIELGFTAHRSIDSSKTAAHAGTEDAQTTINTFDWAALDRQVSQLRIFNKLTIIIKLVRGFDPPLGEDFERFANMWMSNVRRCLPLADERGILTVNSVRSW